MKAAASLLIGRDQIPRHAAAAALAKHRNCELVTGDPEFKTIESELKIAWLK
jgi:predicted nucleic acid-binding protein